MTNKQFDDIFKSKMSGLSDDKSSADWKDFSELLKKSDGFSDVDFDEKVAKKVKGHQAKYTENHWALLKERLEREELIRSRLYFTKLVEIAAIFLLIFAATNFAGLKFDTGTEPDPSMFAHLYENNKVEHQKISAQVANSKIKELIRSQRTQKLIASSDRSMDENLILRKSESLVKALSIVNTNLEVSSQFNSEQTIKRNTLMLLAIDRPIENISNDQIGSLEAINSELSAAIPEINSNPLYMSHLYASTKTKYEVKPYIGVGTLINRSPYDDIYQNEGTTIYAPQQKAGVAIAAGTDKLKIASGIEWNRINYNPSSVNEVYGSFKDGFSKTSLKQIDIHIVKIPIGVKYDFAKKKQNASSSFYVGANLGINGIMHTKYNIENTPVLSEDYRNLSISNNRSNSPESKLSRKDFTPGILQRGGDLVSNLFLDTSFELGYEKKIGYNSNLSASINYTKYLGSQGIGPNSDRYDNLTFNIGVNYLLN